MQSRLSVAGGILACFLLLALASGAGAADYHIASDGSGDYDSLERLREDVAAGRIIFHDGDSIILHNNDSSLKAPIGIISDAAVTLRSQGGIYSVSPYEVENPHGIIANATLTGGPNLKIENLIIKDFIRDPLDPDEPVINILSGGNERGQIVISNSHFEDNSRTGVMAHGDNDITITNTSFRNSGAVNALLIDTVDIYGNVKLNINVDSNAKGTVVWDGKSANADGIKLIASTYNPNDGGRVDMNIDVATGKKLDIRDNVNTDSAVVNFVKTGTGTFRLDGSWWGNFYYIRDTEHPWYEEPTPGEGTKYPQVYSATDFDIQQGTLHLGEHASIYGTYSDMHFASGTIFKPSITVGNLEEAWDPDVEWVQDGYSHLFLGSFNADDGVRLEIGNASMLPQYSTSTFDAVSWGRTAWEVVALATPGENSYIPKSMQINNGLMTAKLYRGAREDLWNENVESDAVNAIILQISDIKNLDTLDGIGGYADVYRKLPTLSEGERDMLDSIYARGGADDFAMGYLQTLSGAAVMNSSLAMRHNLAGVLRAISKRSTVFQKEELEPEVTGSDYIYDDTMPNLDYGQIWAYIDKSWSSQEELGSIAGYRYNPYGIGIGYEWHRDEWIYGGVLRHDAGEMQLDRNRNTVTDVQSIIGSLYASWASDGYYATGGIHLGYGWNESTSAYNTPWDSGLAVTGDYGTSLYGASLEIGRMVHLDAYDGDFPIRVTPYAGLAYARINREAVTESGTATLNKHFRQSVWNMWEYSAGVRVAMPIEYFDFTLIPSVDAAIVRTMGTPNNDHGDAYLLTNPGSSWKVAAWDSNRTALRLNSSVNARFHNNLDVGVSYDFEWRKQAWNHQLSMNMSLGF